ncbi:hypothetical protein [Candidatus Amarolinea dominans]|uniref:hypothetical protein n=1 Tax=Candidatus Amarolinea dominans TaxID=3140696 RepID=UPI001D767424|nr:hypothetical protein [Anaerolineae bacterium]
MPTYEHLIELLRQYRIEDLVVVDESNLHQGSEHLVLEEGSSYVITRVPETEKQYLHGENIALVLFDDFMTLLRDDYLSSLTC